MTTLKTKIMRRIYFVWLVRILMRPWLVKSTLLVLLFSQFSLYVSVRQILSNWPLQNDFASQYRFIESAFANTEMGTLIMVSGITVLVAWVLKDVFGIGSKTTYARA